jgi:hypothetical protein
LPPLHSTWWEECKVSANTPLGKDDNKNDKNPKQISVRKATDGMMLAERETEIDRVSGELDNRLEKVGQMVGRLEGKDREMLKLSNLAKEKEGEILELQEELEQRKEHEVVWVESQLKKGWINLLEASDVAQTAKEARIETKEPESKIHSKLKETLAAMEEMTFRVAVLQSCKTELRSQLAKTKVMEGEFIHLEEQRAWLAALEREVDVSRVENKVVLVAIDEAQIFYLEGITDRKAQINLLNQDVNVPHEQIEFVDMMLEEKEMLASEEPNQLEGEIKDEELWVRELKDNLADKSCKVNIIAMELKEKNKCVDTWEDKLMTIKREFMEHHAKLEAAAAASSKLGSNYKADEGDKGTVLSMAAAQMKEQQEVEHMATEERAHDNIRSSTMSVTTLILCQIVYLEMYDLGIFSTFSTLRW